MTLSSHPPTTCFSFSPPLQYPATLHPRSLLLHHPTMTTNLPTITGVSPTSCHPRVHHISPPTSILPPFYVFCANRYCRRIIVVSQSQYLAATATTYPTYLSWDAENSQGVHYHHSKRCDAGTRVNRQFRAYRKRTGWCWACGSLSANPRRCMIFGQQGCGAQMGSECVWGEEEWFF